MKRPADHVFTLDELAAMTPREVTANAAAIAAQSEALHAERRSRDAEDTTPDPLGRLTRADLRSMTPAAITAARRAGRLDHLRGDAA